MDDSKLFEQNLDKEFTGEHHKANDIPIVFGFNIKYVSLSYLTVFFGMLLLLLFLWSVAFLFVWPRARVRLGLRQVGVAMKRIGRTVKELERKTFHLSGLLIPFIYHLIITYISGFTQYHAGILMITITTIWWILDLMRLYIPVVNRNFPLTSIAREHELHQISGVSYFILGCTIAIVCFPPKISITSIMFMILGDMSAAVFGISFGRVKIGKKSLEGTLAMFFVCFFIGINMFWDIHMREYPVVLGALVAAISELIEPWGINDNLTIPFLSCLALQFGFHRISGCGNNSDYINYWLDPTLSHHG